jgi:hypothetical protein
MAELASLPQLPAFVPDADPTSVAQRWKRWLDRFENLLVALNITDNNRKKALLLHLAGETVYEIYEGLVVEPVDADADPAVHNVYINAKRALDNYFNPKRNAEFEVYTFRKTQQNQEETLDAYHSRLRSQARYCEFANTDTEIKSHIIQTCTSSRLRRRALSEPNLTLQQLLDIGRSMEAAERQVKCIEHGINEEAVAAVSRAGQRRTTMPPRNHGNNTQTCRFCGGSFPHPGGRMACPAWGKTCRACSKFHHFAVVCRSAAGDNQTQQANGRTPPTTGLQQRAAPRSFQRVKQVVDSAPPQNEAPNEDAVDSDNHYLFHVGATKKLRPRQPLVHIKVGRTPMKFTIDTGASVNIIDDVAYSKLNPQPTLQKSKTKLYAYGATNPMTVRGVFKATLEAKRKFTADDIYVVQGQCGSLLSYNTASELDLVKVDVNAVRSAEQDDITVEKLEAKYPQLFCGVGKLKNHEVELHIDPTVKPVAQPHRRIPFHLRKQVEEELKSLLDQDIIEHAEGPTPWLSPIVTPIKPNEPGKVRLCVDMRQANKAIVRERHVMPTLEDVIHDLNGSTVFSKLDLNKAYHQLLLSPTSRSITTFSTHVGLFRYKRLFFGVSSSSEVFQATIAQLLHDIPGVINISDDILVHGRTAAQHNARLHAVIQRLVDNGLTLNKNKCQLSQPKIEYYGHVFSADGVAVQQKHIQTRIGQLLQLS